jgi:hypothetical protein
MATKRLIASAAILLVSVGAAFLLFGNHVQASSPPSTGNSSFAPANTCQEILARAMDSVQGQCDDLGRNKACYGNNRVNAEPNGSAALKFDTVGDRAAIQSIHTLVTSPLNVSDGTWGLSLLKLQANLPDSLPGQNITFLVYGDTSIENASGNMQAFYFTSGLSNLSCKEAPQDGIVVRSPQHTEVTFTANGVQITIASTIVLHAERNRAMSVGLIEGHAQITTNSGSQILKPGEMTSVALGGANGLTAVGAPSSPTQISDEPVTTPLLKTVDKVGDKDAPVNVSIEGCISAITGNTLTIEDYQIQVGNDPVLKAAQVGDCVRIDGALQLNNDNVSFVLVRATKENKPNDASSKPGKTNANKGQKGKGQGKADNKPGNDNNPDRGQERGGMGKD